MQSTIINNEQGVHEIFNKYFSSDEDHPSKDEKNIQDENVKDSKKEFLGLDDEEIIAKAAGAANGEKFNALWSGDISRHASHSEADLAFCQLLAFWTGGDAQQMDRLFRESGLYRDKWDEKRGAKTYGEMTVEKAIGRNDNIYTKKIRASIEDTSRNEYFTNELGTFWNKPTKNGEVPIKLSNFSGKIVREIIHDDGVERTIHVEIEITIKGKTRKVTIPAESFPSMNWVSENCSFHAIVEPGHGLRDRLRHATQVLSNKIVQSRIYTHCGWRKDDTGWFFLHSNGALGSNGIIKGVETDLGHLSNYYLPDPPGLQQVKSYLKAALDFFFSLPKNVGIPLLLSIVRAILSEADPPEYSVHISGSTGVFKSELAAIVLSAFGVIMSDKRFFPGSWTSTANFLERLAFQAKDSILVIDDYAPNGSAADLARKQRDAERIFRGAGNRHGRGRMNIDGSLRPVNFPRGLILSTGEDIPMGHSLRSRLLTLEIENGAVSSEVLSRGQDLASRGILNSLFSAFITWCAGNMDDLKSRYHARKTELRSSLSIYGHLRLATTVGDILTAAEIFGRFATDSRALDEKEYIEFINKCKKDLVLTTEMQSQSHESEDVCLRFFSLLSAVLSSGRGHLNDQTTGSKPDYGNPGNFGWHQVIDKASAMSTISSSGGKQIGWTNENLDLYLDPENAYSEIRRLANDQGHPLPISKVRLFKTLKEKGYIKSHESGRNLDKINILGCRRRVLHLHMDQVFERYDLLQEDKIEIAAENHQEPPRHLALEDEHWEAL